MLDFYWESFFSDLLRGFFSLGAACLAFGVLSFKPCPFNLMFVDEEVSGRFAELATNLIFTEPVLVVI